MLPDLRILYVQFDIRWHDWLANRQSIEAAIATASGEEDLLILPEMFSSGFTMKPGEIAQGMDGPSIQWMTELAGQRNSHVIGSLVISEGDSFFNRLICAHPDGALSHYDKRHLFTFANEDKHYTAGDHRMEFNVKGWKVFPLICYDLRFPVWSRNVTDYDLLIYVANWPSARREAWTTLLRARAIENLCYTVGLNRVGNDANGLEYPGRSEAFDVSGASIYSSRDQPDVGEFTLERAPLEEFRSRYNFLADRDSFIID